MFDILCNELEKQALDLLTENVGWHSFNYAWAYKELGGKKQACWGPQSKYLITDMLCRVLNRIVSDNKIKVNFVIISIYILCQWACCLNGCYIRL